MTRRTAAAATLAVVAFLLAYAPDVGHGFISDDFTWLLAADELLQAHSPALLLETTGFLRPLVTLSFALERARFGLDATRYGMTNLILVFLCAALVYAVCRTQKLAAAAAAVAALTWMFNFHGINMSVLWISGRTSLLLTFFALLAAWNALTERRWWAAAWCAAALLSKEEAIALPFILAAWVGIASWPSLLTLVPYFVLRAQSDAFWPHDVPSYYRFTTDPVAIATNAAHYIDRACTVFVVVALIVVIVSRTKPRLDSVRRQQMVRGLIWLAGGYALTLSVPVRSSLYAVLPSVGAAIVLAAFVDAIFAHLEARSLKRTAIVLVLLCFLSIPVLRARNVRWVELADLTHQVMHDLEPHVDALRTGMPLWIVDDTSTRANIRNAFADGLTPAIRLFFDTSPEIHVTANATDVPATGGVVLRLQDGRLQDRQRVDVH